MVVVQPCVHSVLDCLNRLAAARRDDLVRELFCLQLGFSSVHTVGSHLPGLCEPPETMAVASDGLRVVRLRLDADTGHGADAEVVSAVLDAHPQTIAVVSDHNRSRWRLAVRSPEGRPWLVDIGPGPVSPVVARHLTLLSGRRNVLAAFDPDGLRREFIRSWEDQIDRVDGDPGLKQGMRIILERLCGLMFLESAGRLPPGHTRDLYDRHGSRRFGAAIIRAAARFGLCAPALPAIPDAALESAYDVLSAYPLSPHPDPDDSRFAIDPDILALTFEHTVMAQRRNLRRRTGSFYTPRAITRFMCQEALSEFLSSRPGQPGELDALLSCSICDPAVGPGQFALWMVRELAARAARLIPADHDGAVYGSLYDLKHRFIRDCIRGVDVFLPAVQLCRLRLALELQLSVKTDPISHPPRLPDLSKTIIHGDSLLDQPFPAGDSFDLVIGNPPYLHTRTGTIDAARRNRLRSRFRTAVGQFDVSSLFIELATELLADRGSIVFIHPVRLLSTQNNEPVRRLIRDRLTVQTITLCGMPFPNAGVEACIQIGTKAPASTATIRVLDFAHNTAHPRTELPRTLLDGLPWGVVPVRASSAELAAAASMSALVRRLGSEVTISRGFECGRTDTAISEQPSPGACRLVVGEDVQRHRISWSGLWAAPDWSLASRYKRRELYLTIPKILIRYVSRHLVAAMDERGVASTNVLYHVHSRRHETHLWSVLALLNSEPVNMWFQTVFMTDDLLFPHVQKNQLEAIPLPPHRCSQEEELARLAQLASRNPADHKVQRMIDDLAWNSYGIDPPR